jgi:EAL domain-containing protein (putative c-di-GMP-specific phosphodiesterase class I)
MKSGIEQPKAALPHTVVPYVAPALDVDPRGRAGDSDHRFSTGGAHPIERSMTTPPGHRRHHADDTPTTMMVVTVDTVLDTELLHRCIVDAANVIFQPGTVRHVTEGPWGTALLHLSPVGDDRLRVADPAAPQSLEAEVVALLAARGPRGVAVAAASLGPSLSADARCEALLEERVKEVARRVLDIAANRGRRRALASMLEAGTIRTLFQPIVDAQSGAVLGFESLSRGPAGHPLEHPDALLTAAERAGLSGPVQGEMIRLASERACQRLDEPETLLFVNTAPADMWEDPTYQADWVAGYRWPPERVVLEVSERAPIRNLSSVAARCERARRSGVRFALDDAGAGYAGLAALATLAPEYVKIDLALVRDCDRDSAKRATVGALAHFGRDTGAKLIAEGIETADELQTLRSLGVDYVQGFLLAHPEEVPSRVDPWWFRHRAGPARSDDVTA